MKKIVGVRGERVNRKATRALAVASESQAFFVSGGPALHTLEELANFFEVISKEQYDYHTKRGQNDFALWVESVLGDSLAAAGLRRSRAASSALKFLRLHLKRRYQLN